MTAYARNHAFAGIVSGRSIAPTCNAGVTPSRIMVDIVVFAILAPSVCGVVGSVVGFRLPVDG